MTLAERLLEEINGGSCDLLVGSYLGSFGVVKIILAFIGVYIIRKALDKLAYEPFIAWMKSKIYKEKKDK